jgi:branched-subunit amino acid ABC-type transport system permease component
MKNKLLLVAFGFVFMWTIGEVFNASHAENLMLTFFSTIGIAIWLGVHHEIKSFLNEKLHKAH